MSNAKTFFRSHSRLVIFMSAGVAVILVVVLYMLWSNRVWSEYQSSYEEWHQNIQIDTSNALALPSSSTSERSEKLARLKGITDSIDSQKELYCRVNGLIGWQEFVASNKQRRTECQKVVDTLTVFNRQLQAMVTYLENDHALAKVLVTATNVQSKLTEKQWSDQVNVWSKARGSIQNLTVISDFTPVKELTIKRVIAIEAAWQKVIVANKAKNEMKFVDSEKDLQQAYASLRDVSDISVDHFEKTSTRLQTAYSQTFLVK